MKAATPLLVGSFVLGALGLLVISIVAIHGTQLFARHLRVNVVFPESVAGLDIGAPVTFRGLKIGTVEGMRVHTDPVRHRSWIPVTLEIDPALLSPDDPSGAGQRTDLRAAIAAGLRAQLTSQGLVSGALSVNLDYIADRRASPPGPALEDAEIPAIPSELEALKTQLRALDLAGIAQHATVVLAGMERVLRDMDQNIVPVAHSLRATLATTSEAVRALQTDSSHTLADIDALAIESRMQIRTNGDDLDALLKSGTQTVQQADALVATLSDVSSPGGDLQASLRDLAASLSSLRSVTHDFEHNPIGTLMRRDRE